MPRLKTAKSYVPFLDKNHPLEKERHIAPYAVRLIFFQRAMQSQSQTNFSL